MSQKNIFGNLRDKHGVADLLKEVSKRKTSSLKPKHRKEVNKIVERVGSREDLEDSGSENSDTRDTSNKDTGPRWRKDFFQKFSRQEPQNPLDDNDQQSPRPFFRKFSIQRNQRNQEQDAAGGENDRREEIKKQLERSQQQGREMLQKFSTNFQTFSTNVKTHLTGPSNAEKAARVSETLCELDKASNHSVLEKASNHSRRAALDRSSNHTASSFSK